MAKGRYGNVDKMNFEAPLTSLVWLTSIVSVGLTYVASYALIPTLGDGTLWWKLSTVITCGTLAGAIIPEFVKVFTSTSSAHVREIVTSAREGGASLDILSGLVAGNFSGYWLGLTMVALMGIARVFGCQGDWDRAVDRLQQAGQQNGGSSGQLAEGATPAGLPSGAASSRLGEIDVVQPVDRKSVV